MGWIRTTIAVAGAAAAAGAADAQTKQVVTGPVSTYWMSAQTMSGFGAGMAAGGGRPSMGSMMGAMMGGGSNVSKTLTLQLGSSRKPTGEPAAEHIPPQALRVGQTLPLLTPKAVVSQRDETPRVPAEFQKPKGRMLIFWGCGERARPGQPIVIDFAQVAAGKAPAGMEAMTRQLAVTPMRPPAAGRNTTYGEWPNERTRTQIPADGSLFGDHLVRGTYTPDIKFALNQGQDFLGPLTLTTNAVGPTGAGQLGWRTVPNAKGYLATAIGGGENDTMVMWSSSEVQASAFALPDYLSDADLAKLVAAKALMGPQTTACAIPQEVIQAAPNAMVQLAAYGGETNLSYPPRPADPKVAWNIDWTVKVRYKSQTGGILGMDMADAGGGMGEQTPARGAQRGQPAPKQPAVPGVGGAILRGLGGRIPGL